MDNKIEQFKEKAIGMGFDEETINQFITSKQSQQPNFEDPGNQDYSNVFVDSSFNTPSIGVEDETNQMSRMVTPIEDTRFETQTSMIPSGLTITQPYGKKSSIEKYSGNVNLGTDWAAEMNTPLSSPTTGDWVVEKSSPGWNAGSGNMVQIRNTETNETIGYEHLNKISTREGQKLDAGTVIGLSGNSGNSTGPHISLPYRDKNGQYQDIRNTPYL